MKQIISRQLKRIIAPRLDIPFARDDANRYLPWFIALMIFLAAFFIAGGITVGEILQYKKQNFSEWLTIQMPAETNEQTQNNLKAFMTKQGNLAEFRIVPKENLVEMISPWFGNDKTVVNSLSIPQLAEVRLNDPESFNLENFRNELTKNFPDMVVDDHAQWIDHYLNFIAMLEIGAYLLALLVVAATTVIIIFTSKTALKLHKDAIWLLHSVGAADNYIARQFQFNAFLLAMRGGLLGVVFAAFLFFAVGLSVNEINSSLLPNFPITGMHLIVWLCIPPLTGFLALFVARKTVLAMLHKIT